jgi:hypothetical protein
MWSVSHALYGPDGRSAKRLYGGALSARHRKPAGHVLFRKGSIAYKLNRGLDRNGDGSITKAEAADRVVALLGEGLQPGNIG